ncbi:MAG: hypothetical protein QF837_08980 [Acidimicrobiales bacterium]|jgi:hypothetical protein|nr:hypothetical protein [Acidimicrobiaceae bacterium]MDP6162795.1 hypothetical protein [Acidimicrobiales bacterium]HJL92049.1 hypothetical protein [Acidimicrobiales bacterium]|tara:strand:- start:2552 stop:2824 length:273 start_codon:yes stop_codon:yes gene_type:complete
MHSQAEPRIVDEEGAKRLRLVGRWIAISLPLLTVVITGGYFLIIPEDGLLGALAVGLGTAIWLCILFGAVAGTGIYEHHNKKEMTKHANG